jgi:RNA polymerase sigma-70 factor (ECF subfamily)
METVTADEGELLTLARTGDEDAFSALVMTHRSELRAYCYRMLGSVQDAEDAVQNATLRAWRGLSAFEGRSSVRSWLYTIATNTTLDIARHRSRRELPADFGPSAGPGAPFEDEVLEPVWLEPYPDEWLASVPGSRPGAGAGHAGTGPEARYEQRESVEIAFMIMLQQLPPLQRAVLILRDVLAFSAAEVAAQLSTTVPAVNSALQRARGAAQAGLPDRGQQATLRALGDTRLTSIAARYADALETGDVDALLSMLTQDASWCMPPCPTWFQGHEALRSWLVSDPLTQQWRHTETRANGQLAVGCYMYSPDSGAYEPAVIDVLTLSPADGKISAVTAFVLLDEQVDPAEVFARFGLPPTPPASTGLHQVLANRAVRLSRRRAGHARRAAVSGCG